jgi:hypothetical protein
MSKDPQYPFDKKLDKTFIYEKVNIGSITYTNIIVTHIEPEILPGEIWGDLNNVTGKVTLKMKTLNGWLVLVPETTIENIIGLTAEFNKKLNKDFESYPQKSTVSLEDIVVLFDAATKTNYSTSVSVFLNSPYKGFFATPEALNLAFPIGEDGWHAIVGSTDTVWVWDYNTTSWVNSDKQGLVLDINGQTGHVTISTPGTLNTDNADSLPVNASESLSGNVNLHKVSKTGDFNDLKNKPVLSKFFVQAIEPVTWAIGDFWLQTLTT